MRSPTTLQKPLFKQNYHAEPYLVSDKMVGGGTNSLNISRRFKYQISSQVSPKPTGRLTDCSNL